MSAGTHAEAMRLALADLKRSGLDRKCLRKGSGISVLTRADALAYDPLCGWWRHAPAGLTCLLFSYSGLDGKPTSVWRLRRLEDPPRNAFGVCPDLHKYNQGAGTRPGLWLPRSIDWQAVLNDPTKRIVLVEGCKKAEALTQYKIHAVAVGGVWSFSSRTLGIEILPELVQLAAGKRPFVILYDADSKPETRDDVKRAAKCLSLLLLREGADVRVAHLPLLDGADKTGADDYLEAEGLEKLQTVIDAAGPPASEELTDSGNGERFAMQAAGRFLYAPQKHKWYGFDGRRWAPDDMERAQELAPQVAQFIHLEAKALTDPKLQKAVHRWADTSRHSSRIDAMLCMAPKVAASTVKVDLKTFDTDAWLLNVENGTLDLRTGKLHPHDPNDRITHLASVIYDPEAKSPLWEKTLEEVLPDPKTRGFLQRVLGYCLTGSMREEKLFFFHGAGRNGKNVIIDTVAEVLGGYATVAPEGLLIAKPYEAHPAELMDLRGKRLIIDSETGPHQAWNVARLKKLTSPEPVKARPMYGDWIEFKPSHKFVILGNSHPRAPSGDYAVWARLKLIPFEVTFYGPSDAKPEGTKWLRQDTELKEKLLRERSGVLNWLLQGCRDWQKRRHLGEPVAVRRATAEYRDEQRDLEPLETYLSTCPVLSSGMSLKALKAAVNRFSSKSPVTSRDLLKQLRERGYVIRPGHARGKLIFPPTEPVSGGEA